MRIISGIAKGHTLKAPKGVTTRPTLDRVRESIFNVVANYGIPGKRILDLFSGTGAMALEALSRGASHAIAVDRVTKPLIIENAKHCHLEDRLHVLSCSLARVSQFLEGQQFDYIFSDPPYEKNYINATIEMVVGCNILALDGMLILERHKKEIPILPEDWVCIKEQKFGYTMVSYCVKK